MVCVCACLHAGLRATVRAHASEHVSLFLCVCGWVFASACSCVWLVPVPLQCFPSTL